MTIKDIVISALKKMGADGVCNPENSCGCGLDGLPECDFNPLDCKPAKREIATAEDVTEESEYAVGDEIYVAMMG